MAPSQNNSRQNTDLKITTNNSSREQQVDGSPKNDTVEGDGTTPLKETIGKHGGEEYNVQGSSKLPTNLNINLIQSQVETTSGLQYVKGNIDILLTELALHIFRLLLNVSAACLGLTCPRLYSCLKDQHPEPICLRCHDCCGDQPIGSHCIITPGPLCLEHPWWEPWNHKDNLGNRIKKWMGPQYTLVYLPLVRVKPHAVYIHSNAHSCSLMKIPGLPCFSPADPWDRPVLWRYRDWAGAAADNKLNIYDPDFRSRLPRPCNKDDNWYAEAMAAIKEDIMRFDNAEDWRTFWLGFSVVLKHENTFNLWFEEFSLEQMHDGIKLLGL
jgi:hypothetical protein